MGIFDKFKDKDEPKPDFSKVQSGSSSTAPRAEGTSGTVATPSRSRTYTVQKGDSLSKIALREYGDASEWRRIYDANRELIKDPDLIHPGWTLTIP